MNKTLKVVLPLAFIAVFLSTTMVRAEYNVTVGNTFDYGVVASNWNISYGTQTSTGTGFQFLEANHVVGSNFEIEVLTVDTNLGVDWQMTLGTDVDTGSNSPFDAIGLVFILFLPLLLTMGTISWNQTALDLGPEIMSFFFLDTGFSEVFYQLTNQTFVSSLSESGYDFTNVYGTFQNSTNIAVFVWHLDMTISTSADTLSGTYVWQIAYDQTTGQLKGYYIDLDYSGTLASQSITYKLEQKVEEVGYNLPGVGGFIPGFEWFIAVPALALLGGVAVIIKKRK
ncbi:MAG: hypothetical protein JXA54_13070 [Candidatus Heimdallarchaeota archaeon]|nr:hypothetical protein [Candidatus Heimdallarchaeota archaeon]